MVVVNCPYCGTKNDPDRNQWLSCHGCGKRFAIDKQTTGPGATVSGTKDPWEESPGDKVLFFLCIALVYFCQQELIPGREWLGLGLTKIGIMVLGATGVGLFVAYRVRECHFTGLVAGYVAGFCGLGVSALVLPCWDWAGFTILIQIFCMAIGVIPGMIVFGLFAAMERPTPETRQMRANLLSEAREAGVGLLRQVPRFGVLLLRQLQRAGGWLLRYLGRVKHYLLTASLTVAAFAGILLGCDALFGTSSGLLGNHLVRTLACSAVLGIFLFAAVRARRRSPSAWGACLASGAVLGTAAWCLVPTWDGIRLWDASSRLREISTQLDELDRGEWTSFKELSDEARRIVSAFSRTRDGYTPTGQQVLAAEAAWAVRSVSAVLDTARAVQQPAPKAAREILAECAAALRQARGEDASRERWPEARQLLLRAQLDACRWTVRPLIEADHFEEAAQLARTTTADLDAEAAVFGLGDDLRRFRELSSSLAALARLAR
jgi:hypothetical protein